MFQTYRAPPDVPETVVYGSLADLKNATGKLPPKWLVICGEDEKLVLGHIDVEHNMDIKVVFDSTIVAHVYVFGMPAPQLNINLENTRLNSFLNSLTSKCMCSGILDSTLQSLADGVITEKNCFRHFRYTTVAGKPASVSCVRALSCLLLSDSAVCKNCQSVEKTLHAKQTRKTERVANGPLKPNDPLHGLTSEELKQQFKKVRKVSVEQERKLALFQEQLLSDSETVEIDIGMSKAFGDIISTSAKDPLHELFWEEQRKAFAAGRGGHRWHPMMLRLAIFLHSRSPAAYEVLRTTGLLKLPGSTTLREYKHVDSPSEGFQPHIIQELQSQASKLDLNHRYVALLHDEMSVRQDLVYDKRSGELVGFVNINSWDFDHIQPERLATHVLVFYAVGINSTLKQSIGYFGTRSATADNLYPLFWAAVRVLEKCGFKVIVSTSDKASPNQRLYQLHGNNHDVCFKTLNVFAAEADRFLYFISDPPHLVKTVRNNLANSGSGKNTRFLWKDGQHILWQHIANLYFEDLNRGLRRTKLSRDHIILTPHSVMNVKLAAQVLSCQVGSVLRAYGPPEAAETASFIILMDRFFDCLNTRNLDEATRRRKPDLAPYRAVDDARFDFLEDDFLGYLQRWKQSVDSRPGFTASDRQKMFLSHQTYKGLVMTVKAFVEATKYLLTHGVEFVLSNKFCQDPLEQHFGRHRCLGRTNDNPTVHQFGYHETLLRQGRSLSLMLQPGGNVRNGEKVPVVVTDSPLKKKRKL